MKGYKPIEIRLNSNIDRYKITVYDCNGYCVKDIYSNKGCVQFCARSNVVRVIASPISNQFNDSYFFKLDVSRNTCFNLSFNFTRRVSATEIVNTFFLTDRNYGLRINGNLYFNGIR